MIDPVPWLLKQDGHNATRARRALRIEHSGDRDVVATTLDDIASSQMKNGSFDNSVLKTAGTLNLLNDLGAPSSDCLKESAANFLISVLKSQPGFEQAKNLKPGSIQKPCDSCGKSAAVCIRVMEGNVPLFYDRRRLEIHIAPG